MHPSHFLVINTKENQEVKMYIREEQVTREFTRTFSTGKTTVYKRTAKIAHLVCDNCGAEFTRQISSEIDRKRCNNDYSHYCSDCPTYLLAQLKGQKTRAERSRKRVGERRKWGNSGYYRIYVGEDYPYSKPYSGSVFEHVYIMEHHLNRPLKKGEVVHHIVGDKGNNSLDNLDVMTFKEHNKCHGQGANKLLFGLFKDGIISYDRETKRYVRT